MKKLDFIFLAVVSFFILSCQVIASDIPTPYGYYNYDFQKMVKFLELEDENGVKNGSKLSSNYSPYSPETWGKGSNYSLLDSAWVSNKLYDNIEWIKDETGLKRIGKIDFHISYDNDREAIDVIGQLDTNGFTSLEFLDFGNTSISELNLGYVPKLKYLWTGNISQLDLTGTRDIESIICQESQISDLDLANTPDLKNLNCSDTLVAEINLDKIPKLETLTIAGTQVSHLDLSKVPKLKQLLIGNTQISELDLSKLTNLQYLYCSDTQISELDLSKLTNLQQLNCRNTQISELNLNGVPNLRVLFCENTSISELDLSKAINLKHLYCSDTPISKLNLNGALSLEFLECNNTPISRLDLSEIPNLSHLYCENTLISELDLSKALNLEYLYCKDASISKLNLNGAFSLETLECNNTPISELNLNGVPNLEVLFCENTSISELDLSRVPDLWRLNCNNTSISELNLSKVPNLRFLNCNNTLISELDLSKINKLLWGNCSYCKLGINELRNAKLKFENYNDDFENQNIFDEYIFTKGNIKSFGNETSTYKWFNGDEPIENINTSEFDLSNYIGKKVRCEITDGDITLKSNSPTVIGVEFDNPPESLYKGTETKLSAKLSTFGIEEIEDTSVSWSINDVDNYTSTISEDGILKVSPDETSDCITVRATSNFNPNEYQEVKILIKTNPKSELQNAIDDANKINNKDNATIDELLKAIWDLSNAIIKYHK